MAELERLLKMKEKTEKGIALKVEDVKTEKVLGIFDRLSEYVKDKGGELHSVLWRGMPKNPVEVRKIYMFNTATLTIYTKRNRFHEDRQDMEVSCESKQVCNYFMNDVIMKCLRHYLIPKE